MIPVRKIQGLFIGSGLILISLSAIYVAFTDREYALLILILFGAVGVFVIYQSIFLSDKEYCQMQKTCENQRLVIVRDVLEEGDPNTSITIFELMNQNGVGECYLSYTTSITQPFMQGEKYQIDLSGVDLFANRTRLKNYTATDISYVDRSAIKELSPLLKGIFSSVK